MNERADDPSRLIRWVDRKAASQYVRRDAMIGRVRHWIPHEISGLDKIYPKTGLSFAIPGKNWNAHGREGIGFIVDRNRLANHICDIDGHEIFLMSDAYDRRSFMAVEDLPEMRARAVKASLDDPDEAFVIGDVRELHGKLTGIRIGSGVDDRTRRLVSGYADLHGIEIEKGAGE